MAVNVINLPVLVLNQNYEPLNICRAKRAVVLVYEGKAEMLEDGAGFVRSVSARLSIPSVIRLFYLIKRPRPKRKLTRIEIFNRDKFTCQYCGKESRQLTLDHVVPRFSGGQHTWENIVSACPACNRRKAGRTPEQAGMKLMHKPYAPRDHTLFYIPYQYVQSQSSWQKYLPQSS